MNVSMGRRWEGFVDGLVKAGRYGSASEVVREGLRLVEEREARLEALRETLRSSIDDPERFSADEVDREVRAELDAWESSTSEGR